MTVNGLEQAVEVGLRAYNDRCVIETLWNHTMPGAGVGSTVLRHLLRLADDHGVTLKLEVYCLRYDLNNYDCEDPARQHELNARYLDRTQLLRWYAKHGFAADAATLPDDHLGVSMTRRPSAGPSRDSV